MIPSEYHNFNTKKLKLNPIDAELKIMVTQTTRVNLVEPFESKFYSILSIIMELT